MVGPALFMGTIVAVVSLTTLIVQGLFSMLEATSPLLVSELLHLGLVVAAGLCLVKAMAPGSCFPESYRRSFAPIRTREDGGGETTEEKGGSASSDRRPDDLAPSRRRAPLCVRLFVIVGSYGIVFGFLHVIPLALPLGVVARVASFLVGAVVALALFIVTLRRGRPVDVSLIWNRFYRFVFPVVCVAALLVPLTNSSEFLPALIMQACALYYFDALLAMACSVIGQAINAAPSQVFGRAFLIRSIGFLLGNLVGSTVYERVVLDAAAFSVIGTAVFVLLVLVTFNMNSEKYAKTVWGLLPHEDPRGRYERTRDERCAALADQFGLTERETEVLRLLARNKRPREISDVLVVSVATVRSHVHAIYTKTGVHSAAELAEACRMSPGQKLEKGIVVEKERVEGLALVRRRPWKARRLGLPAEGGDGAVVVSDPEKCNTVTFVGADGMEQSFPLDFLLERGAIVANRVNGEDIMSVMGATNQLWVPGLPAKYFVRDIREIRFTNEEVPPVIGPFVDDGHDYTNRPNVAAKAEYVGRVGEPMEFTGWAHDFDKRIIAVEFSLDNGEHWTRYDLGDTTADRWVSWTFAYTPEAPGAYQMKVRSVNEDGDASPIAAVHTFEVL